LPLGNVARAARKTSTLEQLGHHSENYLPAEENVMDGLCAAFENSCVPLAQRLQTFPRHVRRQDLARFLVRYEIFKLNLGIHGSIVECGVFAGGGLMTWSQCSAIMEPYNHTRRVIGFDTFTGFPHIHDKDRRAGKSEHLHVGAFHSGNQIVGELQNLAKLHDMNRPIGHIPKVELVEGDSRKTIPQYVQENPHLLISLLYLDFDLFEPTKIALEHLLPRVVRGGIVAFDELNSHDMPGETAAFLETLADSTGPLRRFPADPYISYFVK
jgi:hypothetical protein